MTKTELPDYARSRAILIGATDYDDHRFPQLPAAANSLAGFQRVLTDSALCGWPPAQVTVLKNQEGAAELIRRVRRLAKQTEGILLLYFVGHGVLLRRGELCLVLTDTDADDPDVTGVEYQRIREALLDSPACLKIVILDCCYSGRAIEVLSGTTGVADSTDTQGVYTLTASDHSAHVPPLHEQVGAMTSFTGEFLDLIGTGVPGGPEILDLGTLYLHLRSRLSRRSLPAPNQRGTDTAGRFGFTRNVAWKEAATSEESVAGTGVAGAAKAPIGASDAALSTPSTPTRATTATSGLGGRRAAALVAGLVAVAAVVVVAVVLVGALGSKPKSSAKTSPTTSAAAARVAYVAPDFENAIVSAFNSTAGTDSVNGISPKATAATCPAQVTVARGAKFSCSLSGVGGLTGNVSLTVKNSQGTAFSYTGQAKLRSDGNTLNFPLSGNATISASAPASPTPTADASTACGRNALSFCFPATVNGGHAVPPLNPGELSGPQYSYRLVPGSLISDPAAAALYGGTYALAGTYRAASNTVDVVDTEFQNTAIVQNAYAQYRSRLTDQGCKGYDSGTLDYNGQYNGDLVVFSCPGSTTPGQSGEYFISDTTMVAFTGPSASAIERFMVSWSGTGK